MKIEGGVAKFAISEVISLFFVGRTVQWLRWRERTDVFVHEDGSPIEIGRTRETGGERRYTLEDIRAILEALKRGKKIKEDEYQAVLRRIEAYGAVENSLTDKVAV